MRHYSRYFNKKRPYEEVEVLDCNDEGVLFFITHDKQGLRLYLLVDAFKEKYEPVQKHVFTKKHDKKGNAA